MSLIAGISITCFAASYAVALALEVSRLWFRSGLRGALMLGFAGAGLLAHTLFLVHRAAQAAALPLSSWYDFFLLAAWALAALYLYLTWYHPLNPIGLFMLPGVLGLVAVALFAADKAPFPRATAAGAWGTLHGMLLLAGTVAVMLGFVFGLMYLFQSRRLKHKLPPRRGLRFPSLEWLERMNERMIVLSVLLLGLGFLAGLVSNVVNGGLVPWSDPVILATSALVLWMLAVAVFSACYKPARTGKKVAYLTVGSFVFLILALATVLLAETRHAKDSQASARAGRPAGPAFPPRGAAGAAEGRP